MEFRGFPRAVRSIPVPSPFFGTLLEQIDDLAELKSTLRVIWLLHQKKGYPRFVGLRELLGDRTLGRSLAYEGPSAAATVRRALSRAVERGTLIAGHVGEGDNAEQAYMLNTERDRKALATMECATASPVEAATDEEWEAVPERLNIFALYEDNIEMLNPMVAERLREAEQTYPASWLEDAIGEAVEHNKRSWRYITRILERWEREGRSDGEPGGYPKKTGYDKEYARR